MPNYLTKPLVPSSAIEGAQNAIDPRDSSSDNVWGQRLRGFGAGALEGLRQQTSPIGLASMLPMGRIAKAGGSLIRGAEEAPAALRGLEQAAQKVGPKFYDPEAEYAQFLKSSVADDMDRMAKVRGTPADIPNNPAAQQLERLRTGGGSNVGQPANMSVQDMLNPQSGQTMDRMFQENNPIFKQLEAQGMFRRGK